MSFQLHELSVRLELPPGDTDGDNINLSGAAFTGTSLWVVGDEGASVARLTPLPPVAGETLRFGQPTTFPLVDLLALPGEPDDEADLEGMAVADGFLWLTGSHGLKRRKPKKEDGHADNAKRLAKTSLDTNRRLLARIPIDSTVPGAPKLVGLAPDGRRALRLRGDGASNELTDLLTGDAHYGPFRDIPSKDNGLDIEGLAILGEHVLLGLRGPVLGGWAGVLEIAPKPQGDELRLTPVGDGDLKLRKHFLDLGGLGLRDLHFDGDDLYLLAGPTMALDGAVRLYLWRGARQALQNNREPAAFWLSPELVCELPHGRGTDRAEAFCALPTLPDGITTWLALYDAPGPERRPADDVVLGDLLRPS